MQTIAEVEEETEGDDLKTDFSRLKKKKKKKKKEDACYNSKTNLPRKLVFAQNSKEAIYVNNHLIEKKNYEV